MPPSPWNFPNLPPQIEEGELTFLVSFAEDPGPVQVQGPDGAVSVSPAGERRIRFTCKVHAGVSIDISCIVRNQNL